MNKLSSLVRLWDKTSNLGITDSLNRDERRRVRLLNQFAFVVILAGIPSIFYSLLVAKYYDILVIFVTYSLFFSILYLQHHQKHHAARLLLNIASPLIIVSVIIIFGDRSGAEVFYAPLFVTLAIFYSTWRTRIGLLFWLVGSFAVAQVYVAFWDSLMEDYSTQLPGVYALIVSNICCLMMFASYIMDNKSYQVQADELLEMLKVNNDKLHFANDELERFAYVASHQLKAPVRTISNFLKLIEKEIQKQPPNPKLLEYLEYVKGSSDEMAMLINDLLEYSKLEKEEITFETIDLNDILLIVQNNLRATLDQKNAQVTVHELPTVSANKTHMVILFQNLIENAVKYNESSEPAINIYTDETGDLYVKDNGIGIDEQYHQRIFGVFMRLHGQDEYAGTGIGLSACKKIMERHHGDVTVKSKPGEGTTFKLYFPKKEPILASQNGH